HGVNAGVLDQRRRPIDDPHRSLGTVATGCSAAPVSSRNSGGHERELSASFTARYLRVRFRVRSLEAAPGAFHDADEFSTAVRKAVDLVMMLTKPVLFATSLRERLLVSRGLAMICLRG
ncbi:MAG: hypothetical protein ACO3FE_08555, partial [Planctomycetaceae bacterium]